MLFRNRPRQIAQHAKPGCHDSQRTSLLPLLGHLLAEHQRHLVAELATKRRRVCLQQQPVRAGRNLNRATMICHPPPPATLRRSMLPDRQVPVPAVAPRENITKMRHRHRHDHQDAKQTPIEHHSHISIQLLDFQGDANGRRSTNCTPAPPVTRPHGSTRPRTASQSDAFRATRHPPSADSAIVPQKTVHAIASIHVYRWGPSLVNATAAPKIRNVVINATGTVTSGAKMVSRVRSRPVRNGAK